MRRAPPRSSRVAHRAVATSSLCRCSGAGCRAGRRKAACAPQGRPNNRNSRMLMHTVERCITSQCRCLCCILYWLQSWLGPGRERRAESEEPGARGQRERERERGNANEAQSHACRIERRRDEEALRRRAACLRGGFLRLAQRLLCSALLCSALRAPLPLALSASLVPDPIHTPSHALLHRWAAVQAYRSRIHRGVRAHLHPCIPTCVTLLGGVGRFARRACEHGQQRRQRGRRNSTHAK
jgi:hypothetical protein